MTWREYILKCDGFRKKRSFEFEHTRLIVYTLASIYRDSKKPFPSIEEFMPLETDIKIDKKEYEEQFAREAKELLAYHREKYKGTNANTKK